MKITSHCLAPIVFIVKCIVNPKPSCASPKGRAAKHSHKNIRKQDMSSEMCCV